MANQFTYSYLKEAVRAHLDLEEDELEVLNISERFHIFANEAIQNICANKPKYKYFEFTAVKEFTPLVYDNGVIRVINETDEASATFVELDEMTNWYNERGIYKVGQVIEMPTDFISFASKKAYMWTTSISAKQAVTKEYLMYLSDSEFIVKAEATYLVPYRATWLVFTQDSKNDDNIIPMPSDLALTIPIYVASVFLQQRDIRLAQAKRQEFEVALSRCRSTNFLENKDV